MPPEGNEVQRGDVIEISDASAGWSFADAVGDVIADPTICLPTTILFKGDAYDAIHGLCVRREQDINFPVSGAMYQLTSKGTVIEDGVNIKVLSFEGGRMKVSVKCHYKEKGECDLDASVAPITNMIFDVDGKEFQFKPNGNIDFETGALTPDGQLSIYLDGSGSVDIILGDVLLGTLTGKDEEGSLDVAKELVKITKKVKEDMEGTLSEEVDLGGDIDPNWEISEVRKVEGKDYMGIPSDGGCNTAKLAGPEKGLVIAMALIFLFGMKAKHLIANGVGAGMATVADALNKITKK